MECKEFKVKLLQNVDHDQLIEHMAECEECFRLGERHWRNIEVDKFFQDIPNPSSDLTKSIMEKVENINKKEERRERLQKYFQRKTVFTIVALIALVFFVSNLYNLIFQANNQLDQQQILSLEKAAVPSEQQAESSNGTNDSGENSLMMAPELNMSVAYTDKFLLNLPGKVVNYGEIEARAKEEHMPILAINSLPNSYQFVSAIRYQVDELIIYQYNLQANENWIYIIVYPNLISRLDLKRITLTKDDYVTKEYNNKYYINFYGLTDRALVNEFKFTE